MEPNCLKEKKYKTGKNHWNWQGGKNTRKYKCIVCGKEFVSKECYEKRGGNKYCSSKCYFKSGIMGRKPLPMIKKICAFCGGEMKLKQYQYKKRIFCSKKCVAESQKKKKIKKICNYCGKEYFVFPSKANNSYYCSRKCSFNNSGKKRTGKNNGNYIDGRTPQLKIIRNSILSKDWRNKIFKKNKYICQKCNQLGMELNAHHIQNFKNERLRFSVSNGITLCKKCHKEFHGRYGLKNNNKKQLNEFLCNPNQ